MDYKYLAYMADKVEQGSVKALNEDEATQVLARQGLQVLKLEPVSKSLSFDFSKFFPSFFKVKTEDVIVFSRQLKLLTESGTDIITSLELLKEQVSNKAFRTVLDAVISDIRSGSRVADALSKHSHVFPLIYCRSIGVGEQTGEMGLMLEQIADYLERESTKKKGLKSALAYPMVVFFVAIAVSIVMAFFVLPTMENLYSTLGAKIPLLTRLFLDLAGFLRAQIAPILGTLAVITIAAVFYLRTASGKYNKDRLALTLPMVGYINRLKILAYCCRTMAVLFRSGLTSIEIMDIIIDSNNNQLMKKALEDVKEGMLKGEGIAKPMADNRLFLPMMVQMVKVGEETGGLGDTLSIVAETYDTDADSKTKVFVRFIQTAMTVGITVIVSLIAMSMMLAMYGIYGQVKMG